MSALTAMSYTCHKAVPCSFVSADGLAPYVLKTVLNCKATLIAAMLSNGHVKVYDLATMEERVNLSVCHGEHSVIRDIAFGAVNPSYLYVCTSSGAVRCYDIAAEVVRFSVELPVQLPKGSKDDPADFGLYALAVNGLEELMVVSNLHEILFFDIRSGSPTPLGRYFSSHTEAVTQLQFHPVIPHHLLSASDDGLVCVFDTSIRGEDEALVVVYNAEAPVSAFGFFGAQAAFLWIITRTDAISIWNIGSAERLADFSLLRMQLAEVGVFIAGFAACHYDEETERLTALASDHEGVVYLFDVTPDAVAPPVLLSGGHVAAVRSATWARVCNDAGVAGNVLFTGGEDANLAQWTDETAKSILKVQQPHSKSGPTRRMTSWRLSHKYVRQSRSEITGLSSDVDAFGVREATAAGGAKTSSNTSTTAAKAVMKGGKGKDDFF